MCRADLTERAAEEKDMLVLAKEEENIVVNKPALSQIRSICELATPVYSIQNFFLFLPHVPIRYLLFSRTFPHCDNNILVLQVHRSNTPELLRLKSTCRM